MCVLSEFAFFFAFIAFPLSVCASFFFSTPFSVGPFAYTHSEQVVLSFTCTACGSISVVCWCSLCSSQVLWVRMRFRASFCNTSVFFLRQLLCSRAISRVFFSCREVQTLLNVILSTPFSTLYFFMSGSFVDVLTSLISFFFYCII